MSRSASAQATTSVSLGYAALAVGALVVLAFWSTAAQLVNVWLTRSVYSHGLLVLAVSLYIILTERHARVRPPGFQVFWIAAVMILSVGWFAAYVVSVQTAQQILIVALWAVSVIAIAGFRAAKTVVAAILFVSFAIPVWDVLISILQSLTVYIVTRLVSLVGISAVIDGNLIAVESGRLQIARGCSGLGYFLVSVVLAAFGGLMFLRTFSQRAGLVAVAVVASLIANWIRVFIVVLVAHFAGIDNQIVQDHEILGWVVFFVILLPVFGIYLKRFAAIDADTQAAKPGEPVRHSSTANTSHARFIIAAVAVAVSLSVGPILARVSVTTSAASDDGPPRLSIMSGAQAGVQWDGPHRPALEWQPAFAGAADQVAVSFINSRGNSVDARVVLYGEQSHGKELVSYDNSVVKSMDWRLLSSIRSEREPAETSYMEQVYRGKNDSKMLIQYWYQVGDWRGVSPLVAKFHQLQQIIRGEGPQAMVAIGALCESDCESERTMLNNLVADRGLIVRPVIDQQLGGNASNRYVF